MRIIDSETGEPVYPQIGYVDGYTFGDTLLEGCMFEIAIQDGKPICENVASQDDEWISQFSTKQIESWCKEALEAAQDSMTDLSGMVDLEFEE